eukprot:5692251-Ditylum_brightwellii.AAC.1
MNAREILSMLGAEISALIEAGEEEEDKHEDDTSHYANSSDDVISSPTSIVPVGNMAYLQVCIACIECIALKAYELGRQLGRSRTGESTTPVDLDVDGIQQTSSSFRAEIDEDSSYILSVSMAALNGQKKTSSKSSPSASSALQTDNGDDDSAQKGGEDGGGGKVGDESEKMGSNSMISECLDAAKRIKEIIDSEQSTENSMHEGGGGETFSPYGEKNTSFFGSPTKTSVRLPRSPLLSKSLAGGWMSIVSGSNDLPVDRIHRRVPSGISPTKDPSTRTPPEDVLVYKVLNEWISTAPFEDMMADAYGCAYMFHYYRQIVLGRCDMAILSAPLACLGVGDGSGRRCSSPRVTPRNEGDGKNAGSTLVSAQPRNALRLTPPLLSSSRMNKDPLSNVTSSLFLSGSVTQVTGSSDPVSLTLVHSVKSCPRFDGETEKRLVVSMRMYNLTAVPITNGVRLDLSVIYSANTGEGANYDDIERYKAHHQTSTSALY